MKLDTKVRINYNNPLTDNEPPVICPIPDYWIWETQSSILIALEVYDLTSIIYTILVNNSAVETGIGMDILLFSDSPSHDHKNLHHFSWL